MKHHLEWKESTLNIRCWGCSEILVSISTDGSLVNFDSMANSFEINCPNCHQTCEYSLFEDRYGSFFKSHNWDSDINGRDFNGETGENYRNLLRQYKSILLKNVERKKFSSSLLICQARSYMMAKLSQLKFENELLPQFFWE